jgi:hypothetical protein
MSEALSNHERFPQLKRVELILCFWLGQFITLEDAMRRIRNSKGQVQPYEGSEEVQVEYMKAMEPLVERRGSSGGGTFQFELRWEWRQVSPWDWY